MVQRTGVRGINRYGRSSQGVKVMNLRENDEVSAVAPVVESQTPEVAEAIEGDEGESGIVAVELPEADA
jgi:DNA gyrase subunit A